MTSRNTPTARRQPTSAIVSSGPRRTRTRGDVRTRGDIAPPPGDVAPLSGTDHEAFACLVRKLVGSSRFEDAARTIASYIEDVEHMPLVPLKPDQSIGGFIDPSPTPAPFSPAFYAFDERRQRAFVLLRMNIISDPKHTPEGTSLFDIYFNQHAGGSRKAGPALRAMVDIFSTLVARIGQTLAGFRFTPERGPRHFQMARRDLIAAGRLLDSFVASDHAMPEAWGGALERHEFFAIVDRRTGAPASLENTTFCGVHDEVNSHAMLFPTLAGALFTVTEQRMEHAITEAETPRIVRVRLEVLGDAPLQVVRHHELSDVAS